MRAKVRQMILVCGVNAKRRNVFRVAFAYVVLAWLMAQVAELLLDAFGAPPLALKTLFALLLVGFPIVVIFAWAFELTPKASSVNTRLIVNSPLQGKPDVNSTAPSSFCCCWRWPGSPGTGTAKKRRPHQRLQSRNETWRTRLRGGQAWHGSTGADLQGTLPGCDISLPLSGLRGGRGTAYYTGRPRREPFSIRGWLSRV